VTIYSCTVTAYVTDDAFKAVTNTAIAEGIDDDGMNVKAVADATVNITNVPPADSLTKTVTGILVSYEVKVCNESTAESLTVDELFDDVYGNLNGKGTCSVSKILSPSGQPNDCYTCSFQEATTTSPTTDTVTATVNDNDLSNAAMPSDSATVSFE
jgi:hypothetical protein